MRVDLHSAVTFVTRTLEGVFWIEPRLVQIAMCDP